MTTPLSTADILLLSHRLTPLAFEAFTHHAQTTSFPTHESLVEWLHGQANIHQCSGDGQDEHDACHEAIRALSLMPCWHEGALRSDQSCQTCDAQEKAGSL